MLSAARDTEHPWYRVWAAALLTGMRSGELIALTWNDVDHPNGELLVSKSFCSRSKVTKTTKSGDWRSVPLNQDLKDLLTELKALDPHSEFVFPRHKAWHRGKAAEVLRAFCREIGITSVRFHALRACFATQLMRDGVPPSQIMKICGWKTLETMQRYVRMAGIETKGATDSLRLLPPQANIERVVSLFGRGQINPQAD